jgi:hypothetical protein
VLGHNSIRIFEQYYQSLDITYDVQSAFLDSPSQSKILAAAARMSTYLDRRRPWKVAPDDLSAAIQADVEIQSLETEAAAVKSACRAAYTTMTSAQARDPDQYALHAKLRARIRSRRQRLKTHLLNESRRRFDEEQPTRDIQCALNGISADSPPPDFKDPTESRHMVAAELFEPPSHAVGTDEETQKRARILLDPLPPAILVGSISSNAEPNNLATAIRKYRTRMYGTTTTDRATIREDYEGLLGQVKGYVFPHRYGEFSFVWGFLCQCRKMTKIHVRAFDESAASCTVRVLQEDPPAKESPWRARPSMKPSYAMEATELSS